MDPDAHLGLRFFAHERQLSDLLGRPVELSQSRSRTRAYASTLSGTVGVFSDQTPALNEMIDNCDRIART